MNANRQSICPACSAVIEPGMPIARRKGAWTHARCPDNGFQPSAYQEAIFDFVENGDGSAVIEAVAGSGKTETIVRSLRRVRPGLRVAFAAFNKHIAEALANRAPENVTVGTLHSLGLAVMREHYDSSPDPTKTARIVSQWARSGEEASSLRRLLTLARATLIDAADEEAVRRLMDKYGLWLDEKCEWLVRALPKVLDDFRCDVKRLDFDDMPWLPVERGLKVEPFDLMFIDEAQDLTLAQQQLVAMFTAGGGRSLYFGDRAQSLYGFRGADVDAIPHIIRASQAKTFPLSITYRCPRRHVGLAQAIVPHIEARPSAPEGVIDSIDDLKMAQMLRDGDMVICRTNAPLVSYALSLVGQGVKVKLKGKGVGASLRSLARNVHDATLAMTRQKLSRYAERERARMEREGASETVKGLFDDKVAALAVIMDDCTTPGEVFARIETLFNGTQGCVTFSTVHQAKGLEAERVFILRPDLMPWPFAEQEWEVQQEENIEYVAYTRSKAELYFVETE